MDPQELIRKIQRAGYSVTIDADPSGAIRCDVMKPPDASGMEEVIAQSSGRKLSAVLSKASKGLKLNAKPKPKRKKKK